IRLVGGGSTSSQGRVELFHSGQWGTVCDNSWGLSDAHVVCRQLGYPGATEARVRAAFGEGSGPIWLDNVTCDGFEATISDCGHNGWGIHDCGHGEDAGVVCGQGIRLVGGGPTSSQGRVELFHSGQWGTVCDNSWGLSDAHVVCRQLGYPGATEARVRAAFGEGSGPIWLDNVTCDGFEATISDCGHNGWGIHDCGHGEDAGVVCEQGCPTVVLYGDSDTLQVSSMTSYTMKGYTHYDRPVYYSSVTCHYLYYNKRALVAPQLGGNIRRVRVRDSHLYADQINGTFLLWNVNGQEWIENPDVKITCSDDVPAGVVVQQSVGGATNCTRVRLHGGPTIGQRGGDAYVHNCVMTPDQIRSPWYLHDGNQWLVLWSVTASCVRCPTVVLYGGSDTRQAGMMTSYTMTGDTRNDRPVYYSSVTCNYLYYYKPTMEWRVGLQVGNDDGVRVRDSALYADQINGTFLLWNGGEWIENPDVNIACSDDVPTGVEVSQSVGSATNCMRFRLHGDAIYLTDLMASLKTTTFEFTRTDQTSGGRPVYVWDTADSRYFLHFVEREKQWWIGLTIGEHRVYVKNCAMTPGQIRSPWYLRDEYGVDHVVWSVTASCVACSELPFPTNGNRTEGHFHGDTVNFSCKKGYELIGSENRTCQTNQSWSGVQPNCSRKVCQQLMAPSNGNIRGGSSYGDVVTYHCDAGYEISGDEEQTCQSDQTWSGTQPTCVRKVCQQLMAPSNGNIRGGSSYGDVVTYHCDAGYEISGDEEQTCQSDQTWSGTQPTCARKLCQQLMAPSNGNIYGGSSYGDVVTYHCDAGYEISSDEKRTCQSDQTWSGTQPACVPSYSSETTGLSTLHVVMIAVVPSVVLLVLGVVAGILGYRWSRKRQNDDLQLEEFDFHPDILDEKLTDLHKPSSLPPPPVPARPQFLEYEVNPDDLRLNEEIGRGAFGIAFLATLKRAVDGLLKEQTVVAKTVRENAREEEIQNFIQEVDTTITLRGHINLLGLIGCCTLSHPPYLVTEYMPYGDLKNFLLKCRKLNERLQDSLYDFDDMKIYQVARQIANGMAGYVHGDLAARNVLVGEDLVVKIADFGLTTDIYERGYQRQDAEQKIPVRWMAPERLLREGRYTSKSDVWSFGVVLYEIATLGNVPYPGRERTLLEELRTGYREPRPPGIKQELYVKENIVLLFQ
ncbi:regulation of mast cell degranulation, partial [Branchiostoma belcheri]